MYLSINALTEVAYFKKMAKYLLYYLLFESCRTEKKTVILAYLPAELFII